MASVLIAKEISITAIPTRPPTLAWLPGWVPSSVFFTSPASGPDAKGHLQLISSCPYSEFLSGSPFSLSETSQSIRHVFMSLDYSGSQSHIPFSKRTSSATYAKN